MNIQKGQISIVLIFAVFLIGGAYLFSQVKTSAIKDNKSECVLSPGSSDTITFNNNKYYKIRDTSPMPTELFQWHMVPHDINKPDFQEKDNNGNTVTVKYIANIEGKERHVYRPATNCEVLQTLINVGKTSGLEYDDYKTKCASSPDGSGSISYSGDPKALLFADFSSDILPSQKIPGTNDSIMYTKVYLKANADGTVPELPSYIKDFCEENLPSTPIRIYPNESMSPPYSINPAQEVNNNNIDAYPPPSPNPLYPQTESPTDQLKQYNFTLSLFSYDSLDHSPVRSGYKPLGIWTIKNGGQSGKRYEISFASYAGYIALVDVDNPKVMYLYKGGLNGLPPLSSFSMNKNLQMNSFEPSLIYPWGWWTPECKPAVYLYPEQETKVHVAVSPQGFLTYTNPLYPSSGWDVLAKPNGQIISSDKSYPYLYYESKIKDSAINKPQKGFVVKFSGLPNLYNTLLPKLGLNAKEIKDFKDYWEKYLPNSTYYFVGIMPENDINSIEPLTIFPKPTTIIRVRLYFQALDKPISVLEPTISKPTRSGFTVVEWGGMVKVDKEHPFTCSQ